MKYEAWKSSWYDNGGGRLGQSFINEFLPEAIWPDLFYEEDYSKADNIITEYLVCNCYYPNTPKDLS